MAAVGILPGRFVSDSGINIVSRALAAVSQGPVLHAEIVTPTVSTFGGGGQNLELSDLDLSTGTTRPLQTTQSFWIDSSKGVVRESISVDGNTEWESLETPTGVRDSNGYTASSSGNPADLDLVEFLENYKQALAAGRAAKLATGEIDGRQITWIRFTPTEPSSVPEDVAVDSSTGEAVAIRANCPTCASAPATYRVAALEGQPYDSARFVLPSTPSRAAIGLYTSMPTPGSAQDASTVLAAPAAWLSSSFSGINLDEVEFSKLADYSGHSPTPADLVATGRGVTFWYGVTPGETNVGPDTPFVSVAETSGVGFSFHGFNMSNVSPWGQPLTAALAPVSSEGHAVLSNVHGRWTAQLKRGDLYVEIEASSRELAVSAARGLTDVQK